MAKIPQLSVGDTPSAVPRGEVRADPTPRAITDSLGDAAGRFSSIAAENEAAAARQRAKDEAAATKIAQDARDEQQKLLNTVEIGARAGAMEEEMRTHVDAIQDEFSDSPTGWAEEFQKRGREVVERFIREAPNGAVAQGLAVAGDTALSSNTSKMHDLAMGRTTRRVQTGLDEEFNSAMNAASSTSSPLALEQYIEKTEGSLGARLRIGFSSSEVETRLKKFREGATTAYSNRRMKADPLGFQAELRSGAFAKYITPDQHEEFHARSVRAFEHLKDTRQIDILVDGVAKNQEVHRALREGTFDADTAAKMRTTLREQMGTVLTDPKLDDGQRKVETALLRQRAEVLDAAENAMWAQADPQSEDDIQAVADITQRLDDIVDIKGQGERRKVKLGKNQTLSEVVTLQRDLYRLRGDKKITKARFDTLFADIAQVLQPAAKAESKNTGTLDFTSPRFSGGVLWFDEVRNARQAGTDELNLRFKGSLAGTTPEQQLNARIMYLEFLHAAQEKGVEPSEVAARQLAVKALAAATGKPIAGAK